MTRTEAKRIPLCLVAGMLLLATGEATAQVGSWEIGFAGGGSIYQEKSSTSPAGTAKTGFDSSFAASAWLGQELTKYIGGELRYAYGDNNAKLNADGASVSMTARSHAAYYDFHIHTSPRGSSIRPYFSVGGGTKGYFGRGGESAVQPGADHALLTATSEWKPLVTFGGGVKIRVGSRVYLRAELKDYFTPFPTEVILPASGSDLGGWIHNLVPTFGIGIRF